MEAERNNPEINSVQKEKKKSLATRSSINHSVTISSYSLECDKENSGAGNEAINDLLL